MPKASLSISLSLLLPSPLFLILLPRVFCKSSYRSLRLDPRLHSSWLAGYGTFDMRVFTNRTGPVVGKLHIPMYAREGPLPVRMCPPVCIELSQFRAMDQPWFACYRIVRNASNSASLSHSLSLSLSISPFPTTRACHSFSSVVSTYRLSF